MGSRFSGLTVENRHNRAHVIRLNRENRSFSAGKRGKSGLKSRLSWDFASNNNLVNRNTMRRRFLRDSLKIMVVDIP